MFPELVDGLVRQLKPTRAILEGEAVVYDTATGAFLPFQVTMTRKRKTKIDEMSKSHPLRLFAFDVLRLGTVNLIPKTQEERSRRLRDALAFKAGDAVEVTETRIASAASEIDDFFADSMEKGYEGLIAKRLDAPYRPGARGYHWVKLKRAYSSKLRDTVDLVLVGYIRGRGKRAAFGIGSLLGAVYDDKHDRFRTVAKIGSGLSDSAWREMRKRLDAASTKKKPARVESVITPDVWVEPKFVVEVLADEVTRSPFHTAGKSGDAPGYALRFPRMTAGVRTDKAPTDATTEREILEMYRMQGKR
jgi:DNA ligase-1